MTEQTNLVPKRRFKEFQNTQTWEQRKLIEMLIQPITDGPHETPELVEEGIPFISVEAIVDNRIDFARKRGFISEKYNDQCCKKYNPQFHDVYLVKSGATVGKIAIVETYEKFNIWSPLAAMRCGDKSESYFLYYMLQTRSLQTQVFDKCSHGTQPNLSMRQLEQFDVSRPNIEEQKKIGTFFKNLDNVITLHQRKLEKTKALKSAYLSEMFPAEGECKPKRRFAGFTDNWEHRKLEQITLKIGSGKTPKGGESSYVLEGIPLLRSQNVHDDLIDLYDVAYITPQTDEEMKNSRVIKNDVLLNITGASIGRSAVYRLSSPANVNQHVCIVRPIEGYSSDFIQLNLTSPKGQQQIKNNQAGGGREGLNFQQIGKMSFSFPSIIEQAQISTLFKNLDILITLHQRKLEKLQSLKKAYLNEMFV